MSHEGKTREDVRSAAARGAAESVVREAYRRYHHARYIHPDPLEIVLRYTNLRDREVAALICASFALGRVRSILVVCSSVLSRLPNPAEDLETASLHELRERYEGFVYRFFGQEEIAHFLFAIGEVLRRRGSLEAAFLAHFSTCDETVLPALCGLSRELSEYASGIHGLLLSQVERGSAAKRWHLFLRWLVRDDSVDPGGWSRVSSSHLVVPMDTHMHRICRRLGILNRKSADGRAALEVTRFFRVLDPEDPVRFDFSLSRMGIHPEIERDSRVLLENGGAAFSIQT